MISELGYAWFPWDYPESSYMHGVVCDYGTLPGGPITNYNQGDTGVHEVGHYVGLWHTFENGCTPPGDDVDDTPYHGPSAFRCEVLSTCPQPGDDPVHNLMNYTDDLCRYEFTPGQSDRIDLIMPQYRPSMFAQITLDQQRQTGERLSNTTVGRWNGTEFEEITIPDPQYELPEIYTDEGVREVFRGMQEIVNNPTEKYRVWRRGSEDQLDTVQNHRGFTVQPDDESFTSRFHPTDPTIIIKTDLIDAPGTTGGNIQFHDPWYIDFEDGAYNNNWRNRGMEEPFQFYSRPVVSPGWQPDFTTIYPEGPYEYNGVFLNQDPQLTPTYYSVGAPEPNNIDGWESYFLSWTGTNVLFQNSNAAQTPVVFQQAGAIATARYKAHLGSSVSDATSTNSQRKMSGNADQWSLVYPSVDNIWLTESGDGGATWTADMQVSTVNGSAASLASAGSGPVSPTMLSGDQYIVYRYFWAGTYYHIYFHERQNGVLKPVIRVDDTDNGLPLSVNPHPVVGRRNNIIAGPGSTQPQVLVLWEGPSSVEYRYGQLSGGNWNWFPIGSSAGNVPSTTGSHRNPSISSTSYTEPLYVTYDNNNDIFLRPFGPGWGVGHEIVQGSIPRTSYASQVAADTRIPTNHQVHIAWEVYYGPATDGGESWNELEGSLPAKKVAYQGKIGGSWTAVTEYVSVAYDYMRPSISCMSSGNLVMTWDNGSYVYYATNSDGGWSSAAISGPGAHANLVNSEIDGPLSTTRFVSTATSGSPFAVQVSSETFSAPQAEQTIIPLQERYSRRVVAARTRSLPIPIDTSAHCEVELSGVSLKLTDGTVVPLSFRAVDDSLPGFGEDNAWSHLATEAMTLPSAVDSILIDGNVNILAPFGLFGTGELSLRLNFELVDANDTTLIRRLGSERVFNRDTVSIFRVRDRLSGLAGRDVIIQPTLDGIAMGRKNIVYTLVHVHAVIEDTTSAPSSPIAGQQPGTPSHRPSTFALGQNYPNPFNPSTHITYQLPEAAFVSLKVYDMLGREVATLVNDVREAGFYEALFDASSLSSGLYFYRMSAAPTARRKLVLKDGQAGNFVTVRKLMVLK